MTGCLCGFLTASCSCRLPTSPSGFRIGNGAAEVFGCQLILEGVRAVDGDDGNLCGVASLKFGVGEYVNLLVREAFRAPCTLNLTLGVLAQMAALFGVEAYVRFVCHLLFFSREV
jgi:hypothetical protein